jgi:putative membrane-bound dehydrogenase-like protein
LLVFFGACQPPGGPVPPATDPPYASDVALATFEIAPGFRIEPFAAEPLVMDPVAMEIDEAGRLYVVEMPGYPLDTGGSGRIKLLTDTDGDGRPDTSTVFADSLVLPNGILRWKQGVLVTDAPDVLYLADTDGDGRADVREVVLTGFARSNPQHNLNTPVYGLDNGIYLAHEGSITPVVYPDLFNDEGMEVYFPARPDGPRLPRNADSRNVRFHPDTFELEALSSESQFGQTFDAWGHHFFTHNVYHVFQEAIAARYLARNPYQLVPDATENNARYGYPAEVFPITRNPQHQLLTDVGVITSACGITWYLGGAFPETHANVAFVAEPVHNLVHAMRMEATGATFTARRLQEGREFLASTDPWFRPVNFYVGPDGALYLIDYYRQYIEHPEWMDEATVASGALYNGRDRGRIYRIVPEDAAPPRWLGALALGSAPTDTLVQMLGHPNLWWRRHAQRLLLDRRDTTAVPLLEQVWQRATGGEARVHALWALNGLGRLRTPLLQQALRDPVGGVRENALRLVETRLDADTTLVAALLGMADDPDPQVRFQLLATLGSVDTPAARAVRTDLLFAGIEDRWMQVAALSARPASLQAQDVFSEAITRLGSQETAARREFFLRYSALQGRQPASPSARRMMAQVVQARQPEAAWWQSAVVEGMAEGMRGAVPRPLPFDPAGLLPLFAQSDDDRMRRAVLTLLAVAGPPADALAAEGRSTADRLLADPQAPPARRADALRLRALVTPNPDVVALAHLLAPPEPLPVQVAAVEALGQAEGIQGTALLLARWDSLAPDVRDAAVQTFLHSTDRVRLLLDAVAAGKVQAATIGWQRSVNLMMGDDKALRDRARSLLAPADHDPRHLALQYQQALEQSGDAARGQAVFTRVCSPCHQVGGTGGQAFGPDLASVRNRTRQALLHDILNPNAAIADGFERWTAERQNGETTTGILVAETPATLTLRDATGRQTTLARADLRTLEAAPLSAMPAGLETQLTVQEMTDLLAFLQHGL